MRGFNINRERLKWTFFFFVTVRIHFKCRKIMRENAWGKDIYLALRLCATEQRKSSKSHFYYSSKSYGQTNTQFASIHEILVHPPIIYSTAPPPTPPYSPLNTNNVNLISRIWALTIWRDRKSKEKLHSSQMLSKIPSYQHEWQIAGI